jgi:hypothetical protein
MSRVKASVPIPDDWDGETWECICIAWPDSPKWHGVFQGLLTAPTRGRFWSEDTGSVRAAQLVGEQIWENNLDMNPCGGDSPITIDPDGIAWIDRDGDGIPDERFEPDARVGGDTFDQPPTNYSPACIIAAAFVETVRTFVETISTNIEAGTSLLAVVAAIAALIALFAGWWAAAGLLIEFTATCLAFSQVAWDAAFDEDFYADLKCVIFSALDGDAIVTPAEYQEILDSIAAAFDDIQEATAWNVASWLGAVGIQNSPATLGIDEAECWDCGDGCPHVYAGSSGHPTTWWFDGEEQLSTDPIPLDGRRVEIVGGEYYGARFQVKDSFYECGTGYDGFCIFVEDAWIVSDDQGPCPMAYRNGTESESIEVELMDMIGHTYFTWEVTKKTKSVADDQIIHMVARLYPSCS